MSGLGSGMQASGPGICRQQGQPDAAWQVLALHDDAVDLLVREDTDARSFAQALLVSKAEAKRVFARGQLTRAGETLGPQVELQPQDVVRLCFDRGSEANGNVTGSPQAGGPRQQATTPPVVVHQDRILLAVDKPAGILVHGDGTGADTLTNQVQDMLASQGKRAVVQAVQRLDVQTTGLVLFSLTREFQPALDAQVAGHDMRKRYLAVIEGRIPARKGEWLTLDGAIARDRHDPRRMRVAHNGKPSLTRVRTLATRDGLSLLLVELGSGRKHQIRVHLSHAGHPIVGDTLYGGRRHKAGLMLHAWGETLLHPVTREQLLLQTAWPTRFGSLFAEQPWI